MRVGQKGLSSWARWVEHPNQSQPNPVTDLMSHSVHTSPSFPLLSVEFNWRDRAEHLCKASTTYSHDVEDDDDYGGDIGGHGPLGRRVCGDLRGEGGGIRRLRGIEHLPLSKEHGSGVRRAGQDIQQRLHLGLRQEQMHR